LLWQQPRLQSLSHLTSIEVAGTSVSLVDYVKLLGVTFDKHLNLISTCPTSALHPTSISVLSAIFALFLTQKLPSNDSSQGVVNALKTMDIARRNAGKDRINII